MLEIIFTVDGIEQTQIAILDSWEDLKYFQESYKEEVLEQYSEATNIRLGQLSVSIGSY